MTGEVGAGLRLLVVDDLEDIRDMLRVRFQAAGYTVFTAAGGRDAWTFLQSNPVDVVVTDKEMPAGDGLELLARIKAVHPAKPVVIVITGSPDLAVAEIAYGMGAEGVLLKPFALATLVDAIARLVMPIELRLEAGQGRAMIRLEQPLLVATDKLEPGRCRLGRGGLFVMAEGELPMSGMRVAFTLSVQEANPPPAADRIECLGLVRWTRPSVRDDLPRGFGVEFDQMPRRAVECLAKWSHAMGVLPFIPRG